MKFVRRYGMPIRPIEIMKSQEASQIRHMEAHKSQHEQVQIDKSFQNIIQAESTKTVQTMKSENKEFRYDAKEKGSNRYYGSQSRQRGREGEKEKDSPEQSEPKRPGGIDILI